MDAIAAAVADVLGVAEVRLVPHTAGGSRAAFRVETPTDERAAFLRLDDGESGMSDTRFDLRREAAILRRVGELGILVPRVLATFDEPQATLLEHVGGSSRVEPSEQDEVGADYLAWIAAIHGLDLADLQGTDLQLTDLPSAEARGDALLTTTDVVRADLAWWSQRATAQALTERPLIRLAARLLSATVPTVDEHPRLVHGDVGPGNFLVHEGRVTAVLDWELAHLGDVHEDLAWLWMRGAHTDFGDPRRRIEQYEQAAGRTVDEARLDWHLAFVLFKTVTAIRARLQRPGGGRLVLAQQVHLVAYEALLGAVLARLIGASLPLLTEHPEVAVTPETRAVARLDELVGGGEREVVLLLEHLAAAAAQRDWAVRRFAEDLRAACGIALDELHGAIDAAEPHDLIALIGVVGRDADRACWALPPALRRVQRAQRIGLGT